MIEDFLVAIEVLVILVRSSDPWSGRNHTYTATPHPTARDPPDEQHLHWLLAFESKITLFMTRIDNT
jgi:hypothetical protein